MNCPHQFCEGIISASLGEIDPEKQCPIELDEIELYLQILKPAYIFSISMQKNNSTIADTLPGTLPG